ncbi:OmpA family protein, partial [Paraburkholderia sp. SIMBA_061]
FATGLATLTPVARASLDKLLSEREARTYTQVTVTGHTDSVGNDAANLALSKRRAETVAGYLKSHGLNAQAVSVSGRGSADPVASNATAEG